MDALHLIPGLVGGIVTSLVFFAVVWASHIYAMELWYNEAPKDSAPPTDPAQDTALAIAVSVTLLAVSVAITWWMAARSAGFWDATLAESWAEIIVALLNFLSSGPGS